MGLSHPLSQFIYWHYPTPFLFLLHTLYLLFSGTTLPHSSSYYPPFTYCFLAPPYPIPLLIIHPLPTVFWHHPTPFLFLLPTLYLLFSGTTLPPFLFLLPTLYLLFSGTTLPHSSSYYPPFTYCFLAPPYPIPLLITHPLPTVFWHHPTPFLFLLPTLYLLFSGTTLPHSSSYYPPFTYCFLAPPYPIPLLITHPLPTVFWHHPTPFLFLLPTLYLLFSGTTLPHSSSYYPPFITVYLLAPPYPIPLLIIHPLPTVFWHHYTLPPQIITYIFRTISYCPQTRVSSSLLNVHKQQS